MSPLLLLIFLITPVLSDPRADLLWRACTDSPIPNIEPYRQTFENLTTNMKMPMKKDKFSYLNGTARNTSMDVRDHVAMDDKVFVFAQCVDDLSSEDCFLCFEMLKMAMSECFPASGGRVYLDGCYMRVDSYDFSNDSIILDSFMKCGEAKYANQKLWGDVKETLAGLKTNAPNNNGYAALQDASGLGAYGMANCWKNMNYSSCVACLENAYQTALKCLPSTEGRVVNTGCFMHYADYKFVNDVIEEPEEDNVITYGGYVLGAVAVSLAAIGVGFCVGNTAYQHLQIQVHAKNQASEIKISPSMQERTYQFLQFKYSTLQLATENFNEAHKIGQGGFGEVYKGTLKDGREFAIKRLFVNGKSRSEDLYTEIDIISKAQHKNLVHFLGCCFTDTESFIIYEYLANRSLDRVLFDPEKKKDLDWTRRLGIILGTARGLEYLHTECQVRIIHRDIKASNVLLDLRYKPKIADFGLARFSSCDQSLMATTIAGTLGYMAPEYLAQGRLTEKVDVYSFGVLVLEIVSGMQNCKFQATDCFDTLVTYAWREFQLRTSSKIIDSSLSLNDEEDIKRIIHIGLLCTQEVPNQRPSMGQVIEMIVQRTTELPYPGKPPFVMDSIASVSVTDSSKWHDTHTEPL